MSEKLKPCPFCGHKEVIVYHDYWDAVEYWMVECAKCSGSGPNTPTEKEAIDAWNGRVG